MNKFAEKIKALRLGRGYTLRKFCQEHEFDPGNHSRLERGQIKPPQDREILTKLAYALGLEKNTDEWDDFMNCASVENNRIPDEVMTNQEIVEKLPMFFRTITNEKVSGKKLEELITLIKST